MQEALDLFKSIISLAWFKESTITLLFTKLDLFEEKIKEIPICDYFPDYTGCSNDSTAGLRYFIDKFLSLNKSRDRRIEVSYANVTDTKGFEVILQAIMNIAINT